jgi:hypothetical protein
VYSVYVQAQNHPRKLSLQMILNPVSTSTKDGGLKYHIKKQFKKYNNTMSLHRESSDLIL